MKKELEYIRKLLENHVEHLKMDISRLFKLYMMLVGVVCIQLMILIYDKL